MFTSFLTLNCSSNFLFETQLRTFNYELFFFGKTKYFLFRHLSTIRYTSAPPNSPNAGLSSELPGVARGLRRRWRSPVAVAVRVFLRICESSHHFKNLTTPQKMYLPRYFIRSEKRDLYSTSAIFLVKGGGGCLFCCQTLDIHGGTLFVKGALYVRWGSITRESNASDPTATMPLWLFESFAWHPIFRPPQKRSPDLRSLAKAHRYQRCCLQVSRIFLSFTPLTHISLIIFFGP